ncbi:hypothetical protein FQZ97_1034430 [compost metagenome]
MSIPSTCLMQSSRAAVPAIRLAKPGVPTGKSKLLARLGRRRSASISRTFSICPRAKATLAETVLLPSPGIDDVTTMTLCGLSTPASTTPVRMVRIASEKLLSLSVANIRASRLRSLCFRSGRMPSTGIFRRFSNCSVLLTVLFKVSSNKVSATPRHKAIEAAMATISVFLGLIGEVGTTAGSTTRALPVSRSEVAVVSFRRVRKVS